jgi:hypothetical protein
LKYWFVIFLILQSGICMAADEVLVPLWDFLPGADRYSIGWRMGRGENYVKEWWDFYAALPDAEKASYKAKYPEPQGWEGFYTKEHPRWDERTK